VHLFGYFQKKLWNRHRDRAGVKIIKETRKVRNLKDRKCVSCSHSVIGYTENSVEGCVFRILVADMCIALAFFLEHDASNNI
jgi:hypothetical protein